MAGVGRMEALVENPRGRAPVLLTCEHATNVMPPDFEGLGLSEAQRGDHIAWDIGAFATAKRMADYLDAALIGAPASRLLVDPNRAIDAPDLIPETAEGAPIPGNLGLSAAARAARVAAFHTPYHEAVEAHLRRNPQVQALVSVHSFTPELLGVARPWHAGILHAEDTRLGDVMLEALSHQPGLVIGRNQPYAPEQGVYYSMHRHAGARATVMLEVRNDLIRDEIGQARWARLLADALSTALAALEGENTRTETIGGRN
jgi:predicted N-formylglutamate amidohydrolase